MQKPDFGRRGVVLLEALVALAVLSIAGLSLLEVVGAAQRERVNQDATERLFPAADRVMTAMVLLTRQELDRRVGRHSIGEFLVSVARPEQTLYRVSLAAASAPEWELLATVMFRQAPAR